jgi:hypothetical protein
VAAGDDQRRPRRYRRPSEGRDTSLRIGSLSLVSQLLRAGLVDRLRLLVFPLIAGETGQEPAFARLPDIGLDLVGQSVLDGRIVLSEYRSSGVPPYAS